MAEVVILFAERKELEELEEKRRKQELQIQKSSSFQDAVNRKKEQIDKDSNLYTEVPKTNTETSKLSVKEQMELLQQVKVLLDAGVLTQDEFDQKKKEILNG